MNAARLLGRRRSSTANATTKAAADLAAVLGAGAGLDALMSALEAAKGAGVEKTDDAWTAASAEIQRLLDERLAQAQASQVRATTVALRNAIDAASQHTPSERSLAELERALEEADEVGVHRDLISEGHGALKSAAKGRLHGRLQAAIAN